MNKEYEKHKIYSRESQRVGGKHYISNRARAEAIKWVKEAQEEQEKALEDGEMRFHMGWQEALERFFNITEEELKNEN